MVTIRSYDWTNRCWPFYCTSPQSDATKDHLLHNVLYCVFLNTEATFFKPLSYLILFGGHKHVKQVCLRRCKQRTWRQTCLLETSHPLGAFVFVAVHKWSRVILWSRKRINLLNPYHVKSVSEDLTCVFKQKPDTGVISHDHMGPICPLRSPLRMQLIIKHHNCVLQYVVPKHF